MMKIGKNKIIMTDTRGGKRAFTTVAGCCAFGSFYLVLMSAVTNSVACLLSVTVGMAVVAAYLILSDIKRYVKFVILGVIGLYSALCVAIGFDGFATGFLSFVNNVAYTANETLHYGFSYVADVVPNAGGDFLFCSVLSAWLGLGTAAIVKKRAIAYVAPSVTLTVLWLCLGLFTAPYAMILFVISLVGLLLCDREFTVKAGFVYLAIAAAMFVALSPCFIYSGSGAVGALKSGIVSATQNVFYGSDNLPEGKLENASGMRSDKGERLRVTLSGGVRNLYLRGFVGGDLDGNVWKPTDRNAYVSDGYQGILDYVADEKIPFMQYSRYSALGGKSESFDIEIENVGALRKYVYLPYTVNSFDVGRENYDMNVTASVFTPRKYSVGVFAGDKSSEVVQQARWLNNTALQTPEMKNYVAAEAQYRGFADNTYTYVDQNALALVRDTLGISSAGEQEKINPAANLIRNYFRTNFEYSDVSDKVGDDFIADFFGGKIKKATAAYFASAATVAFRAYGYAARYVEGYLVYADEGQTEVSVTGNYSHAWTEVYFDGIGWLPIEVTPGFFTALTEIDPDDPETPENPEPVKPPDDPIEIDPPHVEPTEPEQPLSPDEQRLLSVLKVLLAVACVILFALLCVSGVVVHKQIVLKNRRKQLDTRGETFGRNVYGIMEKDFGKNFIADAESYGINSTATERFTELVQRCVYGDKDLSAGERNIVLSYMNVYTEAYLSNCGKVKRFGFKYIKCIGI